MRVICVKVFEKRRETGGKRNKNETKKKAEKWKRSSEKLYGGFLIASVLENILLAPSCAPGLKRDSA